MQLNWEIYTQTHKNMDGLEYNEIQCHSALVWGELASTTQRLGC